jgi:hypothetical protein
MDVTEDDTAFLDDADSVYTIIEHTTPYPTLWEWLAWICCCCYSAELDG